MKYYLYTFNDKIEGFKIEGFKILTELEKDMDLVRIKKEFKHGGTISYGDDEEYDYKSLRQVLRTISIKEISYIQYNSINLAFGGSFGNLGPLDCFVDEEEDEEYCEDCGDVLTGCDETVCEYCKREDEEEVWESEYNAQKDRIVSMIKQEFNIEEGHASGEHSAYFVWKPTNKTQIEISVKDYDNSGDDEVEINLKHNNRGIGYESFEIGDADNRFSRTVKNTVDKFLDKARSY